MKLIVLLLHLVTLFFILIFIFFFWFTGEQLCPSTTKNTVNKNANRMVIIAALVAPSPESINPPIPSLMQSILYCDVEYVRFILSKIASYNEADAEEVKTAQIFNARIDGNRNILHAVVMNCFSTTNKDQADKKNEEPLVKIDGADADATRSNFDRKWQEMIGGQAISVAGLKKSLEGIFNISFMNMRKFIS